MEFIFNVPSKVLFGDNYADNIGTWLKDENVKKVMCVYDKGVEQAGISERIISGIQKEGIETVCFAEVLPDPPVELIDKGAAIARAENVQGVVGIGGGSSMDTAKCINALLGNEGRILEYSHDYDTMTNKGGFLLLVPTTFGTGSEVTDGGVLSVPEEKKKISIWGKNMGADLSVIDPTLALGIPKQITAATGMDALSHAVESYMSMIATPVTEALSLEAIRIISSSLPDAVVDGGKIENRRNMCLGCLVAGIAFNNAFLNQGHGLAHPIGAHWHVPHGVACAIALPFSVADNAEAMPDKVRRVGEAMGIDLPDTCTAKELGSLVADQIIALSDKIGIPTLKELCADPTLIESVAEAVKKEPDQYTYPHIPETKDMIHYLNANFERRTK